MKKFFYTLLFVSTAILTSCGSDDDSSSDDDGTVNFANTVSIDDQTFDVTTAQSDDFGTNTENTGYYNVDFILGGTTADDEDFQLYVETFSAGDSFSEGTFVFQDGSDISEAPNQFFNNFLFGIPTLMVGDTQYFATEGTVIITGTSPNYTFEADLTTEDGTVINAEFSGEFTSN